MGDKDLIGVNKSFCISLKRNESEWKGVLDLIHSNGFPSCEIFEGVEGSSYKDTDVSHILSPWQEYILKYEERRHNHEHFKTWGGMGCYLSHLGVWKNAIDKGYERIAVFEDDIYFNSGFKELLATSIKNVPADSQLLLLDSIQLTTTLIPNTAVSRVFRFFGTHGYVINRDCMIALISRALPIELQIDSYMSFMIRLIDLKVYNIAGLCGQTFHVSNIQTTCINCPDLSHKPFIWLNLLVDNIILVITSLILITVVATAFFARRNCKT